MKLNKHGQELENTLRILKPDIQNFFNIILLNMKVIINNSYYIHNSIQFDIEL